MYCSLRTIVLNVLLLLKSRSIIKWYQSCLVHGFVNFSSVCVGTRHNDYNNVQEGAVQNLIFKDFYVNFFVVFLFFFCNLNPQFSKKSLHWKLIFMTQCFFGPSCNFWLFSVYVDFQQHSHWPQVLCVNEEKVAKGKFKLSYCYYYYYCTFFGIEITRKKLHNDMMTVDRFRFEINY